MHMLLIAVHFIVCCFLIGVILLQAGRGGGMSGAFGANQMESFLGTGGAQFLQKVTSICAVMFLCTSLALAVLSGSQKKSVIIGKKEPVAQNQDMARNIQQTLADVTEGTEDFLPANTGLGGAAPSPDQ